MKKGFYKILIVLMSLALIGLIIIQVYWLRQALISARNEFDGRIYQAMNATSDKINQLEQNAYYQEFGDIPQVFGKTDRQEVASRVQRDSVSSTHIYLTRYVLERTQVPLSEEYQDSVTLANLYRQERTIKFGKDSGVTEVQPLEIDFENTFRNASYTIERFARIDAGKKPIRERLDLMVLDSIFTEQLNRSGIKAMPQIAVLSKDSAQVLMRTEDYQSSNNNIKVPLFTDSENQVTFYFSSFFPERKASILRKVLSIAILTLLFVFIIVAVFALSIYYMRLQRKISEVKTDFINNMTHELKTPLATISLATDALKNERVISDQDKVKHYSNLIKQENKRMNNQVEMVLRMSRLEKNQITLNTEPTELNDLIAQTVEPIRLIVESDRNGTVFEDYKANRSLLRVDPFHIGNIVLNVLENANKYSPESPQIYVKTYNKGDNFVLEVQDKGVGMSKTILKKIFEQFYRAETGNIHNVKGQGLGLAYVKKIVELHKGTVWAESEKGKGSNFFIQLPIVS